MASVSKKKVAYIIYAVLLTASFVFGVWFWVKSIATRSVAISFGSATADDGWFESSILHLTLPLTLCMVAAFAFEMPLIILQRVIPNKSMKIIYKIALFIFAVLGVVGLAVFMTASATGTAGKVIVGILVAIGGIVFFAPMFFAVFVDDFKKILIVALITAICFFLAIFTFASAMYFLAANPFLGIVMLLLALGLLGIDGYTVVRIVIIEA